MLQRILPSLHQTLLSTSQHRLNTNRMSGPDPAKDSFEAIFERFSSSFISLLEHGFTSIIEHVGNMSDEKKAEVVKELEEVCWEAREKAAWGRRHVERRGVQGLPRKVQRSEDNEARQDEGSGVLPASWETRDE